MLDRAKLVNVLLFMERVPVTGKEAFAWVETYHAVQQEVERVDLAAKNVQAMAEVM